MYLRQLKTLKSQRGSMLMTAIFIVTVMIFLAVSMQEVFNNAARSVAYEVYGTRALQAANAGAERVLQKIFNPASVADELSFSAVEPAAATASLNFSLASVAGFYGCSVSVSVNRFTINDTSYYYNYTHYRVESTATCDSGGFKTVRTVSVEGRER